MSHMPRFSLVILQLLLLLILLPWRLSGAARNDPGGRQQAAGVHLPIWKLCLLVALLVVATMALLAALIVIFVCRRRNQNASVAVAVAAPVPVPVPVAVAPAPQISEKRQVDKPKPKRWSTHLRPSMSPRNPMSINPTMVRTPSPYRQAASRPTDPDTDELESSSYGTRQSIPTYGEWQSSSERQTIPPFGEWQSSSEPVGELQSSSDSYVAMFYKKVRASSSHWSRRPPRPAQVASPLRRPAGPSEQAPSAVVLGSPALVRAYMIQEETVMIQDPLACYSPSQWVRLLHIDYNQLEWGTNEFKRKSMPGGHGPWSVVVIKTQLVENKGLPAKVTIKRHHSTFREKDCEHIREELMRMCTLRHRNLVKLHGYTLDKGRLYLVYDYMLNGSLENHLFPANGEPVLDWQSRYNIAKEVAQGLDPLHVSDVPHGSISVSSIMLDYDYTACLDDHLYYRPDISSSNRRGFASASTTAETGASLEADIADLGAVFLELVCGRRRTDTDFSGNEKMTLVDWVWKLYGEAYKEPDDVSEGIIQRRVNKEHLFSAVDKTLTGEISKDQALKLLILGLACSHPDSKLRPKIRDVRNVLLDNNPVVPPRLPLSKPTCA